MNLNEIDPRGWTTSPNCILDENEEDVLYNLSDIDGEFMHWVLDAIQEYVSLGGTPRSEQA